MSKVHFFIKLLVLLFLYSCSGEPEQGRRVMHKPIKEKAFRDSLKRVNRFVSHKESELIEAYIDRHQYKMEKSGSGLRYMIYKQNKGKACVSGSVAEVHFKISLLNGTECYSSREKGTEKVKVDQDDVESGLHEALKLMKVGEKAIFILPPHLAHGLIGDSDKIPPLTTVVYDIELIAVTNE